MFIKKTLELPDGSFTIEGTFSPEEVALIIEAGLNTLYRVGALPLVAIDKDKIAKISPMTGTPQ